MDIFDDFSEKLAGEVMADMAENYFGERKRLDDLLDIFQRFVDKCREKGEAVERCAGLFNALLTGKEEAARFYESIGVDNANPLLVSPVIGDGILDRLPDALTRKGRYIETTRKVYDLLRNRCEDYLHGPSEFNPEEAGPAEEEAHYELVLKMAETINRRIEKINESRSAGSMLQYVRGFQPEWDQKANIAGSNLVGFAEGVDRKLVFEPIRFETLNLKRYPDIPEADEVAKQIKRVCKELYSRRGEAVAEVMEGLKTAVT